MILAFNPRWFWRDVLLRVAFLGECFELGVETFELCFQVHIRGLERGALGLGLLLLDHDGAQAARACA
jgi:hypothetical protein